MRRWTLLLLVLALAACKRGGSPAPEPQATLPLLEDGGLPMGVQLIAARRDDGRLLRSARWLVQSLAEDV